MKEEERVGGKEGGREGGKKGRKEGKEAVGSEKKRVHESHRQKQLPETKYYKSVANKNYSIL